MECFVLIDSELFFLLLISSAIEHRYGFIQFLNVSQAGEYGTP